MTEEEKEIEVLMTERQYNILMCFRENPNLTQKEIGKIMGLKQAQVSKALIQIVKNNPDNFELCKEISLYNKAKKYNAYKLFVKSK